MRLWETSSEIGEISPNRAVNPFFLREKRIIMALRRYLSDKIMAPLAPENGGEGSPFLD